MLAIPRRVRAWPDASCASASGHFAEFATRDTTTSTRPHNEWYCNNGITNSESFHTSVFHSCLAALGLDLTVEDSSSHSRLDMEVRFGGQDFEFKLEASGGRG